MLLGFRHLVGAAAAAGRAAAGRAVAAARPPSRRGIVVPGSRLASARAFASAPEDAEARRGPSAMGCAPAASSSAPLPGYAGPWPAAAASTAAAQPPQPPQGLREEVGALRAAPPAFVTAVGDLAAAALVVDSTGSPRQPSLEEGPWDVFATLAGGDTDVALRTPLRVRLRFGTNWPQEMPSVRYCGLLEHPMLDADRGPPVAFYARLRYLVEGAAAEGGTAADGGAAAGAFGGDARARRLVALLRELREFFLDPLKGLRLEDAGEGFLQRLRRAQEAARRVNRARVDVIDRYAGLARHPELLDPEAPLRPSWFAPEFWAAHQRGTPEAWRQLLVERQPGEVYSMPLLSEAFCNTLLDEIFNFYSSGLPARRPNSMNNYGIVLNDIGLESFIDKLQNLLQPLGSLLFPGPGNGWDGHHSFIVRYRESEDLGLDMHTDDSDVTFNTCLGLEFAGAGLQFCGRQGSPDHRRHKFTYQHEKGRCVIHLGTKRHGADDISQGERLNLILWNHSSEYRRCKAYRQPSYAREAGPPDPVCVSYTHDRDFGLFRLYPKGQEKFRGRGWCPPPQAQYEGFKADTVVRSRL